MEFTKDQITVLCGGELPDARGFSWDDVEFFRFEDGALQPYCGDEIQSAPGIILTVSLTAELQNKKAPINRRFYHSRNKRRYMAPIPMMIPRSSSIALLIFVRLCSSGTRSDPAI